MFSVEELEELIDEIAKRITIANRTGTLAQVLDALGMHDLIEPQIVDGDKKGKIVVLGASDVDEKFLLITAGKLGIDKKRFEFCLEYDDLQKYNYRKLQYSDNYRVVLVGPMPHSAHEKGDSGSIIAEMESRQDMYPRIIRVGKGPELKITKSGFKETLSHLISEGYIETDHAE